MLPCSSLPRAISNTAMSLARLAWGGNDSRRADLWWLAAGGTRHGRERYIGAEPRRRFASLCSAMTKRHDATTELDAPRNRSFASSSLRRRVSNELWQLGGVHFEADHELLHG